MAVRPLITGTDINKMFMWFFMELRRVTNAFETNESCCFSSLLSPCVFYSGLFLCTWPWVWLKCDSSVNQELCVCAWWGRALLDDLCQRSGPVWSVFTLNPGEVERDCPGFSTLSHTFPDVFLTSPFLFFLVGSFPVRAHREQENKPHLDKSFSAINGK